MGIREEKTMYKETQSINPLLETLYLEMLSLQYCVAKGIVSFSMKILKRIMLCRLVTSKTKFHFKIHMKLTYVNSLSALEGLHSV